MKNTMKKALALALAVLMMASLSVAVFADGEAELTGGEVGGFTPTSRDTPTAQNKTLILKKELTAYNADEAEINAPTISYTYAIAAGDAGVSVTDEASDHTANTALTVPTKAGITEGVAITGTAKNTIAWTNTDKLVAATNGAANYKDLKIDFSKVVFTGPGVYRYVITETPPVDYAASGVTATTGTHTRYLDVYVKAADTFNDGSTAEEWVIYGYVCMYDSEDVDPVADTTTTGAMKTNGFVAGTNDGTEIKADSYYTFNVTVSKTVQNDNYAKATHAFPFTVIFTNAAVTQSVDISSKTTGTTPDGFIDPAPAALSAGDTKDIVSIKDGAAVKYIGIPNGTSVEVYETNDMTGVIYQVTTTLTPTGTAPTTDNSVSWDDKPTVAVAQAATKAACESTKASIVTKADADDDNAYAVAVTNRLLTISPTGVSLRVAPYALMLCAGLLLVFFSRRRKANAESED